MNIGGNALSLAETQFGLRLLNQLVKKSPGENVIVSPIGLFQALSLYASLAGDAAKQEMRKALRTAAYDDLLLHHMYQSLAQSLSIHSADAELDQATAFWAGDAVTLDPAFHTLAEQWDVAVFSGADVTAERMRAWASEKTRGLLEPSMLPPPPQGANLMNAVYFRGTWESKFDPANTKDRPFYRIGGLPKPLPLMRQSETHGIHLYHNTAFDAARIPYKSESRHELSLHVILPRRSVADRVTGKDYLTPFLSQFTLSDWDQCQSGYTDDALVDLILPHFTFRQTHDLKRVLMQMGLRNAFDATAAQMTPFVPAVDEVRQQVYVAVDEEGTIAVALTEMTEIVGVGNYMSPPPPKIEKFYADRPFLFLLSDDASGLLLFAGVIHDPEASPKTRYHVSERSVGAGSGSPCRASIAHRCNQGY